MKPDSVIESIFREPQRNRVGIVALSMPSIGPRRIWVRRALDNLRGLGLQLELGESVFKSCGYKSASAATRARDVQQLLLDSRVRLVLNTTGGYNSNEILEHLDYSRLAKVQDKLFVGYSDITAINLALYARTQIGVVQGPMLVDLTQDKLAFRRFFNELRGGPRDLTISERIKEWGKRTKTQSGTRTLRGKKHTAQGRLIAGNLSTFNLMLGTAFMPPLRNQVLFLEYDKEESKALPSLERMLWQLRLSGSFEHLSALVFGSLQRAVQEEETATDNIERILVEVTRGYRFPVIFNAQFGHIYPSWYLPFGSRIKIAGQKIRIG